MDPRRLSYLMVVAVLAAFIFYAFSPPSWEKQYRATADALEKAKSFRVQITTHSPDGLTNETLQEANCPSEFHSFQRQYAKDGTIVPPLDIEIWSSGNKHVLRQDTKFRATPQHFGAVRCGDTHLLELGPIPSYKLILLRGRAARGTKKTVDGHECRVWTVQYPEGDGWGDLYDMCVDGNNLPLEIIARNGTVAHASHWNERIEVPQPPEVPADTQ